VLITIFYFNPFIRGFVGDILVVILIFSFIKTFICVSSKKVLLATLLFAFGIEFLQLFEITKHLNIQSKLIKTILGTSFEYTDFIAYIIGCVFGGFIENILQRKRTKTFKN
tara:strand:+ start:24217 stop:24549 length:333 start_codon:yes stop_codon:yes gene_type:complete